METCTIISLKLEAVCRGLLMDVNLAIDSGVSIVDHIAHNILHGSGLSSIIGLGYNQFLYGSIEE